MAEPYDAVRADYLLGAVKGFAPYFPPYLFHPILIRAIDLENQENRDSAAIPP